MTYKQQAEELKKKIIQRKKEFKINPSEWLKELIDFLIQMAKTLKAKIKAEGCDKIDFNFKSYTCGELGYCPDCQEAIKILDEVLE